MNFEKEFLITVKSNESEIPSCDRKRVKAFSIYEAAQKEVQKKLRCAGEGMNENAGKEYLWLWLEDEQNSNEKDNIGGNIFVELVR